MSSKPRTSVRLKNPQSGRLVSLQTDWDNASPSATIDTMRQACSTLQEMLENETPVNTNSIKILFNLSYDKSEKQTGSRLEELPPLERINIGLSEEDRKSFLSLQEKWGKADFSKTVCKLIDVSYHLTELVKKGDTVDNNTLKLLLGQPN